MKRDITDMPTLLLDRHKLLQILTNLISNAAHALAASPRQDKMVTIRAKEAGAGRLWIEISDNGVGIPKENLTRIFEHGFTTRKKGHGFGLHSAALSVSEMGGSIEARSDQPGNGAVFTIELPMQTQEARI